jgi:bone morphogenetic protein receptor type-2
VVAVKVFNVALKQYYDNERAVYTLPLLDHDALPKFFGSGQWAKPQGTQYFIVMSYMPLGSLLDYLRKNTLDFATLHRMCRSLASALSHLHTDYQSGGNLPFAFSIKSY